MNEAVQMYKWVVEFMRVDSNNIAIKDSSWFWTGEEYGAGNAVSAAINAMCDSADDPGRRRVVRLTNVTLIEQVLTGRSPKV